MRLNNNGKQEIRMRFLVVGGAGYIGSHMLKHLLAAGHAVVVADNFSTGHRSALLGGTLVELDIADADALDG
jgi:UDP-glucose 4-epimerase